MFDWFYSQKHCDWESIPSFTKKEKDTAADATF